MPDCECLAGCIFFNDKMAERPATSNVYKRRYCQGDNSICARYIVFKAKGKDSVPPDLYPNEHERVEQFVTPT